MKKIKELSEWIEIDYEDLEIEVYDPDEKNWSNKESYGNSLHGLLSDAEERELKIRVKINKK